MNNSSVGWEIPFQMDKWYQYTTSIHRGTGMTIYHVGEDSSIRDGCDEEVLAFTSVPFVESKFKELFDNIQ